MYNKVVLESIYGVVEYIYIPKEVDVFDFLGEFLDKEWNIIKIYDNESDIPIRFEEFNLKGVKIYQ